ncbi:transposase [Longilinea arvoryzae]|uniref:Transposase n=1 Tax=Longilinea arvoryzae TaxID=360412 RepID=A0A0S7B6T2_9CHLR|nr:transposase [Longilinea arvoryzae]GAP12956.1 transposase [Longilinea arvoryzae]
MPFYRRLYVPGCIYFFTVVTFERRKFLVDELARKVLHQAYQDTQSRHPFESLAICLLPDHLHCLWQLPENDSNFSIRWASIKGIFSRNYLQSGGMESERNASRMAHREVAIWQRRFWEHLIRDEEDLERHFDYIHYNPIHHGYVSELEKWPWSTFHRYYEKGQYSANWGHSRPESVYGIEMAGDVE